jgi:hypothetical protein
MSGKRYTEEFKIEAVKQVIMASITSCRQSISKSSIERLEKPWRFKNTIYASSVSART